MSKKKVLVFLGSTRDGRNGLRVARMMSGLLSKAGITPAMVDPLALGEDVPLLRQPFHWLPPEAQAATPEWMRKLNTDIADAAGFLLVSSEYNSTIPPALTNLIDHFPPSSFRHKPVSIVTYSLGPFGGIRAKVALLPFVNELGMVCLPSALTIPAISTTDIDEDGQTSDEKILKRGETMCNELSWYISALQSQKAQTGDSYPN